MGELSAVGVGVIDGVSDCVGYILKPGAGGGPSDYPPDILHPGSPANLNHPAKFC